MAKKAGSQKQSISDYIKHMKRPVWKLSDDELHELLDNYWYPRANDALHKQRRIWDYSYLAYKGIVLYEEINRARRKNGYDMYVHVPRTFMTIEGVRRNFNLNQLRVRLSSAHGTKTEDRVRRNNLSSFLNYDIDRSKTREQAKDAGFDQLLFGDGYLLTFLIDRKMREGEITGAVGDDGRVPAKLSKNKKQKYYGMAARRVSPYHVFPDPDGTTLDVTNHVERTCNYVCLRQMKHIENFRNDWRGVIPEKVLSAVRPGGLDMTNYEYVREMSDYIFDERAMRYPGTMEDYTTSTKVVREFNNDEFVEERIWLGPDFLIVQAGKGMKICLVSPNSNPLKRFNLTKLSNVRIPGEFHGLGEPYLIRYQQVEENRVHNSILDLIHFVVSGSMGINTQYLEDPYDIENYPGKVWKFKAMPGVAINDVMQNFQPSAHAVGPALKFGEEIKKIGQSTTSITDFVTGASQSIADSATEASKLSSASDVAITDKVRKIAEIALRDVSENMLAMYNVVYEGKKIELADGDRRAYFTGKNKDDISESELAKIIEKGYEPHDIIYLDDTQIDEPRFVIEGDIEVSKDVRMRQWTSAIDMANKLNETAFSTGDARRLDTFSMGIEALRSFSDVMKNPQEFLMEGQATKMDEMQVAAQAQASANQASQPGGPAQAAGQAQNPGGRPQKNKVAQPRSQMQQLRTDSQPNNRDQNQRTKKNQ